MDLPSNTLSSEISIALGIIRRLPITGKEWKMSDGNGVVSVFFDDQENGDFLGKLRAAKASERNLIAQEGDILLCKAIQTQRMISVRSLPTLTKSLTIKKVTAVSKRMRFGN